MNKRYLSNIIGDDYKSWKPGQNVVVCTTTGSGKTWFVLNRLLPYAKEQGKHIVIYCNRKFLNMQVQAAAKRRILDDMGKDQEGLAPYLHIKTYQQTEHTREFPSVQETNEKGETYYIEAKQILYYVFDEAMYMVQDAAFNENTGFWGENFRKLTSKNAVSVFLTATPEPLYLFQWYQRRGIDELCKEFIARHSIHENTYYRRWARYLNQNPDVEQPRLKEYLGDPYSNLFSWVEEAYNGVRQWADYLYEEEGSLSDRYDYADMFYFDDIVTLANLIAKSVKERRKKKAERIQKEGTRMDAPIEGAWLVFVRRKEDAKALNQALRALDCASVIITSEFTKKYDGKPAKRKNSKKDIFYRLINEEYLSIDVLISTSVLDCGVTFHAKNVSNLVICQPNKTSFLQMLGRIRVRDGERINLFIQSFTPKQIDGYGEKDHANFLFLVRFMMVNKKVPKSWFMDWREPNILVNDPNDYMAFLPDGTREGLVWELEKDEKKREFLIEKDEKQRRRYDLRSIENCDVNPLAVVHFLGQIYFYEKELPKHSEDKYRFLKAQLSWIGKPYNPECWIDYQALRIELNDYLLQISTQFSKERPMDKQEQNAFKETCFGYLRRLREAPESFLKAKRRHCAGGDTYPGKSKLNEVFLDLGIPYAIDTIQDKKLMKDKETGEKILDPQTGKSIVDNKTYWYLTHVDLTSEQKKQEERREEKQIRREERKAEKKRQEAEMATAKKERKHNQKPVVEIRKIPVNE